MSLPAPDSPLISVITVCFNAAAYLEHTIRSVLDQTHAPLEYIIIDGGSTDGSVAIIRRYASRLAYWHSRPDRGLAHAFNLGLALARGDWIIFLNADDFFLDPQAVARMVPQLQAHPGAEVVFGDALMMTRGDRPQPAPLLKRHARPWEWRRYRMWGMFAAIPHQAAFTHRRYFDRVGEFDESYRGAVDYEHYLRGGPGLQAHYVQLPVSGMRLGGLAARHMLHTLREYRRAQQHTGACSPWRAWVNFFCMAGRFCLSRLAHTFLDPLSRYLPWKGRFSGKAG